VLLHVVLLAPKALVPGSDPHGGAAHPDCSGLVLGA